MADSVRQQLAVAEDSQAATKLSVFLTAERLCALNGFQKVSVRDITAAAGVNLASVNYHFGSKDGLLFEIFLKRTEELSAERGRMLQAAKDRHGGKPPVRDILEALFAPPLIWSDPGHDRRISVQFLIRARSEGTAEMREALQHDITNLERFAEALIDACPHLPAAKVYWRLHFSFGMIHNNRFLELERLTHLSKGLAGEADGQVILNEMLDFAVAGFAG